MGVIPGSYKLQRGQAERWGGWQKSGLEVRAAELVDLRLPADNGWAHKHQVGNQHDLSRAAWSQPPVRRPLGARTNFLTTEP